MIDQRRARIRSFLALAEAPDDVLDERFDAYLRSYREGWRAIPGGPEVVLRLLDEGYRVGVLTNGQGAQQRAKLAAIGLTDPGSWSACPRSCPPRSRRRRRTRPRAPPSGWPRNRC